VTDHTGLEGPGRVAFNRIVRRSHSPNRINVVVTVSVRVRIARSKERRRRQKRKRRKRRRRNGGFVVRVIHGTSRVVNWTVDGRGRGRLDRRAQRPLTVSGRNRRRRRKGTRFPRFPAERFSTCSCIRARARVPVRRELSGTRRNEQLLSSRGRI